VVGVLTMLGALAGYALAWRARPELRVKLALPLLFGLLWGVLWFGFVRFGGKHYLLHVLPIIVATGWLLLGQELWRGSVARRMIGVLLGLVLVLQAGLCFWFGDLLHGNAARQPLSGIFAQARPPLQREDAATLRAMVDYLHATSGNDDRIAVIASSPLFNQDLLSAVDRERAGTGIELGARLPIVAMPEVDRRDPLSLDAIAQATILVVVIPPQYHLRPAGQQVIGSVLGLLAESPDFAHAWKKDDRHFMLDHGLTVDVIRLRQPWTPARLTAMAHTLRDRAAPSGSPEQDWVLRRADFNGRVVTDAQNRSTLLGAVMPQNAANPLTAFFIVPLEPRDYRVVGKLAAPPECAVTASFHLLDGDGKELRTMRAAPSAEGVLTSDFSVVAAGAYLQLSVQAGNAPLERCPFTLEGLQVLRR
jgi:hypothetical protein